MKRTKKFFVVLLGLFIFLSVSIAQQEATKSESKPGTAQKAPIMLTTPDLKWIDSPTHPPGVKLAVLEGDLNASGPYTMRVKFPANLKIPAHWHAADEHVTVLSGTVYMGLGDKLDEKSSKELPPGSFVVIPAKTHHFAWTKAEAIIQIHGVGHREINYVNPADGPGLQKSSK